MEPPAEVRHVVERLTRQGFGYISSLGNITPDDNQARIVILHGQVHRALRVARTIADLAGEERVTAMRLAEALQYRAYEARRFVAR